MKRTVMMVALISAVLLTGCQSTQYEWNHYSDRMYQYYSEKIDDQQYMNTLLRAEKAAKGHNRKLGPGLFAEIGTMYLRMGKAATAIEYYKKEADTWPESKGFMTSLVEGISRLHPTAHPTTKDSATKTSSDANAATEAKQGEQK